MLALSSSHFIGQKFAVDIASPTPATVKIRSPRFVASYTSAETRRPLNFDSSRMASSASLYEVLGVPMGATCQEIKTAYRKLARTCHPDVVAIGRKDTSADEFMKIHTAYSTLSDPNKRADYDRKIFRRQQRPFNSSSASATSTSTATTMSGFSCYTRRAWETDQCW